MSDGPLQVIDHPGWLEVLLDRPAKRNALTPELLQDLATQLDAVDDQAVVVLRGSGDRAFSAGFDLDVLRELGPRAHDGDPLGTAVDAIRDCRAPVIALLQGYCWGAAVELVTACDIRIGTSDLSIAVPANKLGSLYRPVGIDAIAHRYGTQTALDLFVFGLTLPAQTALARGVISAVVEPAESVEYVHALATRMQVTSATARLHRQFLRERKAPGGSAAEFWARWEAVRADGVESRSIPDAKDPR